MSQPGEDSPCAGHGHARFARAQRDERGIALADACAAGARAASGRPALFDALVLTLAMVATHASAELGDLSPPPVAWSIVFILVTIFAMAVSGAYRPRVNVQFLDDLRTIVGATALAAMAVTFARVVLSTGADTASQEVRAWLFSAVYLAAGRAGIRLIQARRRRQGWWSEPTLIVGPAGSGTRSQRGLEARPSSASRPVAFLDDDPLELDEQPPCRSSAPPPDRPAAPMATGSSGRSTSSGQARDRHLLARQPRGGARAGAPLPAARGLGVADPAPVRGRTRPDAPRADGRHAADLGAPHRPAGWQFEVKYALDRVARRWSLIVLVSPLLLFAAVGDRHDARPADPVPSAAGRHRRARVRHAQVPHHARRRTAGRRGARTRSRAGHRRPGGVEGEDRRTRVRRLPAPHLDRRAAAAVQRAARRDVADRAAARAARVTCERFEGEVYRYADRHRVKSGITGWAQVHGLRGQDIARRSGRVGQLLHRELVAVARPEDRVVTVLAVFRPAE